MLQNPGRIQVDRINLFSSGTGEHQINQPSGNALRLDGKTAVFPDLRLKIEHLNIQPVAPSDFIGKFLFLLIKKANLYLLPVCSPAPEIEISVFTVHQFLLEVKLRCPSGLF